MKFFLFFLFLTPLFANEFSFEDRPYSFQLSIRKDNLNFSSESYRYSLPVSDCNLPLARELNAELIANAQSEKNGKLKLRIDNRKVSVGKNSSLRNYLRNMSIRIRQFSIEEKKKCDK